MSNAPNVNSNGHNCGIYIIISPNNNYYIGQSRNFKARIKQYKRVVNRYQHRLYYSLVKYGFENHKFELIHPCEINELNFWDIFYIEIFDTFNTPYGLNLTSGGSNPTFSQETIERFSKAHKGRVFSEEHKRKIALSRLGKPNLSAMKPKSEEHRRKIGLANKTRIISDESRRKISESKLGKTAWNKGLKMTPEQVEANRIGHLGIKVSDETKIKLSASLKGRLVSDETKKKMREIAKNKNYLEHFNKNK